MKYQIRLIKDGSVKIISTHYNPDVAIEKMQKLIESIETNEGTVEIVEVFSKRQKKRKTSFIDLGLPSGTLWADRNLGANSPEDYGDYFRFGETTPYTENSPLYEFDEIEGDIAGTDKDAATVILGGQFRMPTIEQFKELVKECSREWTEVDGIKGVKVTGPNGNSIFLPAAGFRHYSNGSLCYVSSLGFYWSASPDENNNCFGRSLDLDSSNWDWFSNYRGYGFTVRAVKG